MIIGIGDYVTTQNSDTHKRVIDIKGNVYALEWYSYEGIDKEFISFIPNSEGKPKIIYIGNRETKQYSEQKQLYKKGKETFHAEQERKRKHRIQIAKERDFRKAVSKV